MKTSAQSSPGRPVALQTNSAFSAGEGAAWRFPGGKWAVAGLLVLVLLAIRLWQPGRFITPDEIIFLDHSRAFLLGLVSGDFSLTLGIGYPGVTVAWVGALGLAVLYGLSQLGLGPLPAPGLTLSQFLDAADAIPLPYYVAGRVATVLLVAVLLLVVYVLLGRLWPQGRALALVATLLLALDPFLLGYSRLLHIAAPLALLMLSTVLAWLVWLRRRRAIWLLLSGVLCGLAFLTKTTALLLLPMVIGLAALDWWLRRPEPLGRRVLRVVAGGCLLAVLTALVTVALWPAMWHEPGAAMNLTFGKLWIDKDAGEGNLGMYWMGHFVQDPGLAFYPVALLLKISPLMLLGVVAAVVPRRQRDSRADATRDLNWLLITYAVAYLLVMTGASKKSVRYLLPGLVALAPIAAVGWLRIGAWLRQRFSKSKLAIAALPVGFVGLLLALALPYAPYYFSYYNPAVLGWRWAPRTLLVGWGEGLGDAATFLNHQPEAEAATVTAWYDWVFSPYFVGQTVPFSSQDALVADYSVLYINQVQRDIPDPNLIMYFQRRQPLSIVRLNGIDYVWIYPSVAGDRPLPETASRVDIAMGTGVTLEGYEVHVIDDGRPGVWVTLYWRAHSSELPDTYVYVRAVDGSDQIVARADSPPAMGFYPTSRWRAGQLVADVQELIRPEETTAGTYRLEVGMYDPQNWAVLEPATGERGAGGGAILGEVNLP